MSDDLEVRALQALRKLFAPLPVSIERRYRDGRWSVLLGRDEHWAGGLTLTKRETTIHGAIAETCSLLRKIGRRGLVAQLQRATGGATIELPEEWFARGSEASWPR